MKIFKRFHFAHQGFRACFRRRGKLPRSVRLNRRGGKRPDFTGLEVATQMLNFVIMTYFWFLLTILLIRVTKRIWIKLCCSHRCAHLYFRWWSEELISNLSLRIGRRPFVASTRIIIQLPTTIMSRFGWTATLQTAHKPRFSVHRARNTRFLWTTLNPRRLFLAFWQRLLSALACPFTI